MKKALAALPLLALLVLAGCSNGNQSGTSSSSSETSQSQQNSGSESSKPSSSSSEEYTPVLTEPTTVTIWTTIGQKNRAPFEAAIASIEEKEPNLTVNNVYQSAGYDELHDMVVQGFPANNFPDLVYCYPDHVADYINAGRAVNLEPYINNPTYGLSAEEQEDLIDAFMEEGQEYTVEGTYSVPFAKSTEALYYNRGALVGLNLSSIDPTINDGLPLNDAYLQSLTWDELFDKLCPAIVKYNETTKIIDLDAANAAIVGYDSDDNLFITLAKQYGYGYTSITESGKGSVDFNNEGMKSLLTRFHNWATKGYIASQGTTGSYTSDLFKAGSCLFSVSSTAGVGYLWSADMSSDVGVGRVPQAPNGTLAQISQGPSFAVLDHNNENQKIGAWLVYKELISKTYSTEWAINTGYMGIRDSFYESSQYLAVSDIDATEPETNERLNAENWLYYPKVTDIVFTSPVFKGSAEVRDQAGGLMTWALNKNSNLDDIDEQFEYYYNNALNAL